MSVTATLRTPCGRENWVTDGTASQCSKCGTDFNMLTRKHHCRACGNIFCWKCSSKKICYRPRAKGSNEPLAEQRKRVCDGCFKSITEACFVTITAKTDAAKKMSTINSFCGGGALPLHEPNEHAEDAFQEATLVDQEFERRCSQRELAELQALFGQDAADDDALAEPDDMQGGQFYFSQAEDEDAGDALVQHEAALLDLQFDVAIRQIRLSERII